MRREVERVGIAAKTVPLSLQNLLEKRQNLSLELFSSLYFFLIQIPAIWEVGSSAHTPIPCLCIPKPVSLLQGCLLPP